MFHLALMATLAAEPGATVTPFRTEVSPRVDPVFGDVAALRQSVDRFLGLQGEMDQVRTEFSTAVHGTLAQLATVLDGERARELVRDGEPSIRELAQVIDRGDLDVGLLARLRAPDGAARSVGVLHQHEARDDIG